MTHNHPAVVCFLGLVCVHSIIQVGSVPYHVFVQDIVRIVIKVPDRYIQELFRLYVFSDTVTESAMANQKVSRLAYDRSCADSIGYILFPFFRL